jgi:sugar phosphate isomerase/epimerase
MEYGINLGFILREIEIERAAELIAGAGFKYLDYTPSLLEVGWEKRAEDALKIIKSYGLRVYQTHVPFHRHNKMKDIHRELIKRCGEVTEIFGASFMVAHGDEFDFENMTYSVECALEYNHNHFLPAVERAKKNGYKVAFETVFEDVPERPRFSSRADELKSLILSYNSESAVCCWDFGHAHVSFRHDASSIIRDFGSLIKCTHLHDNTGVDSHQIPLTGDIRWGEVKDAFADINYDGIMSIEYSHGRIPEELAEDFLKLSYSSAKHIFK